MQVTALSMVAARRDAGASEILWASGDPLRVCGAS